MKKALAMGLGALLLVGSAAPAFAASQIDFSGFYRTVFANEWNKNDDMGSNSEFRDRLQLNFGFHPTDEISVFWTVRSPRGHTWGTNAASDNERAALTNVHYYGQIKQDWGTLLIGRLAADYSYYGLGSLGWNPGGVDGVVTEWGVFDLDGEFDGITYINRWDNGFQLVGQFLRLEAAGPVNDPAGYDAQTADLYILQPSYHWDEGGASLGLLYLRDKTGYVDTNYARGGLGLGPNEPALTAYFLNPAFAHSFGDFSLHFEGMFGWAKAEIGGDDVKPKGYGLYLDGNYNYGPGNVTLAGWWTSGSDGDGNDEDPKNLVDMGLNALGGNGFRPLVVAYGDFNPNNMWNPSGSSDNVNAIMLANELSGGPDNVGSANHWGIALAGSHAFTDDLALNYAAGYLALNKTAATANGKTIGTELDLGIAVNLLDNLEFRSTAGYLIVGNAFGDDAKDMYSWYNTLYFRF